MAEGLSKAAAAALLRQTRREQPQPPKIPLQSATVLETAHATFHDAYTSMSNTAVLPSADVSQPSMDTDGDREELVEDPLAELLHSRPQTHKKSMAMADDLLSRASEAEERASGGQPYVYRSRRRLGVGPDYQV